MIRLYVLKMKLVKRNLIVSRNGLLESEEELIYMCELHSSTLPSAGLVSTIRNFKDAGGGCL